MTDNEIDTDNSHTLPEVSASGLLPFDPNEYLEDLSGTDLTEQQRIEFLQALWSIMVTMVNLGFSVDSVIPAFQMASEPAPDAVEQDHAKDNFNIATHEPSPKVS